MNEDNPLWKEYVEHLVGDEVIFLYGGIENHGVVTSVYFREHTNVVFLSYTISADNISYVRLPDNILINLSVTCRQMMDELVMI